MVLLSCLDAIVLVRASKRATGGKPRFRVSGALGFRVQIWGSGAPPDVPCEFKYSIPNPPLQLCLQKTCLVITIFDCL